MASPKTQEVFDAIVQDAMAGKDIVPASYQPRRGRANYVTAAIRKAKAAGLIEVKYKSVAGTPVYQPGPRLRSAGSAINPAFPGQLGTGQRFAECVEMMESRPGVYDAAGLCAAIGRRKYGGKGMARLAAGGRRNPRWEGAAPSTFYNVVDKSSGRIMGGQLESLQEARETQAYYGPSNVDIWKQTWTPAKGYRTVVVKPLAKKRRNVASAAGGRRNPSNYASAAARVRKVSTPAEAAHMEKSLTRLYNAGQLTVSEYGRLDVLLMNQVANLGGRRNNPSVKQTMAAIRNLGLSVKRDSETGEYRVNYKGGREATAYYTEDAEDALGTAREMAQRAGSKAVGGRRNPTKQMTFNLRTVKGNREADKYEAKLKKEGYEVTLTTAGPNRITITGRKRNPMQRTARKRTTAAKSAASRWGVYVKDQLAYVSTDKLSANKAASKLKLSGRAFIKVKKVGANPVSGKVPKIGWREQFKKAAYAAIKSPAKRRASARATASTRRAMERRSNPVGKRTKLVQYIVGGNVYDSLERAKKKAQEYANDEEYPFTFTKETTVYEDRGILGQRMVKRDEKAYTVKPKTTRRANAPSALVRANPAGGYTAIGTTKDGRETIKDVSSLTAGKSFLKKYSQGVVYKDDGGQPRRVYTKGITGRMANPTRSVGSFKDEVTDSSGQVLGYVTGPYAKSSGRGSFYNWELSRSLTHPHSISGRSSSHSAAVKAISTKLKAFFKKYGKDSMGGSRRGLALASGWKSNPKRKTRRPANPTKGTQSRYAVYVGDKPAWIGRLKSKANAAASDLMDRGRAGVKIYQVAVTKTIKDGWRKAFVN